MQKWNVHTFNICLLDTIVVPITRVVRVVLISVIYDRVRLSLLVERLRMISLPRP